MSSRNIVVEFYTDTIRPPLFNLSASHFLNAKSVVICVARIVIGIGRDNSNNALVQHGEDCIMKKSSGGLICVGRNSQTVI